MPKGAQYLYDIEGLKGIARELLFIQDNALAYPTKETKDLLATLAIIIINWPPYSLDLNLIKTL